MSAITAAQAPTEPMNYPRPSKPVRRGAWIGTGLVAALLLAALVVGLGLEATAVSAWLSLALTVLIGIPIAAIDRRHHLIPNWLVAVLAAGTLAASLPNLLPAVLAAVAVGGVYLMLNLLAGIGMGDVKLAAVCALSWGVQGLEITIIGFVAAFAAAFPMALHATLAGRRGMHVAFGPWILLGSLIALTWSLLP